MPLSDVPPETIFKDALSLGYPVFAFIYDEEEDKLWCITCRCWLSGCNCFKDKTEAEIFLRNNISPDEGFRLAMERIHGGPLTPETEMGLEDWMLELDESTEITFETVQEVEEFQAHITWHDPANPDAIVDEDGPCFCGWLGIDPPLPEYAPPGCSCVDTKHQDEEGD